ncbi:MAG: biopolymer transporter ExbD [Bryobacterales bacterium]|nr:biopolymer transporter ExbD [Bryobacterales bacterium]
MAFSQSGGGGGGRRRSHGLPSLSEMNVTPFVDVVLVLLVIFMLTAHVMEFGIEVEVPKVRQVKDTAQELPVVTITRAGKLYLNDKEVNYNELTGQIQKRFGTGKGVYLRADKQTVFDPIAQVMSVLGEAKIPVNVVTKPVDAADEKGR